MPIAIFLLSAAIIAYQLVLMQVLSIVQWHHLAFMVISTALLGFGVAGTFLSLFREKLLQSYEWLFPALMFCTSIGFVWAVPVSQTDIFRFDLFLLFSNKFHALKLLTTYLLFFIPFFTGALAIGLSFIRDVGNIGKLYFSNLIGSGAGGLAALALMKYLRAEEIPAMVAALAFLAGLLPIQSGLLKGSQNVKWLLIFPCLFAALSIVGSMLFPQPLRPSEFKDLSKTLLLPDAKIELEKNSPQGLLQVVSSPALRYAPGLSLNYQGEVPVRKVVFINGNWIGTLAVATAPGDTLEFDYSTAALPWQLYTPQKVLIPGVATGEYLAYALSKGAEKVTALETNAELTRLLCDQLTPDNDSLFHHPAVELHTLEAQTWLRIDTQSYDLILLPDISSFGGNSGVQAIQENYTLTLEAIRSMLGKLKSEGLLSVTCWLDYPTRFPLKMLATLTEALILEGITNPKNHIVAIRSWGTITFAIRKEAFTKNDMELVRRFCQEMSFDPALLPALQEGERQQYNALQDERLFDFFDQMLSSSKDSLIEHYPFNIRHATDQRPFFSQFIKWAAVPQIAKNIGTGSVPFLELGYLMVVVTFLQVAIVAIVLILLPLIRLKQRSGRMVRNTGWVLLYFGGIGIGFMFVEIVLIQQFTLFFGSPIYSAAAVITGLLIFSGIGSYFSPLLKLVKNRWLLVLTLIAASLGLLSFYLNSILMTAAALPLSWKILVLLALLLPLGFLMGLPFPAGLTYVSMRAESAAPWAWAVNGYFSVISTVLATIVAVELGFSWVMLLAAAAYLVAAVGVMRS